MESLEIIVKDKRDFEDLKEHATYFSEITRVMEFHPSTMRKGVSILEKYFSDDEVSEIKSRDTKYIVDIDDKRKISIIAPDTYLSFTKASKPKGSSMGFVSVVNLKEIYILLKYKLVEPTNNFKEWYSKIDSNCKLSDLHSYTNKKKFRNNNAWTFESYFKDQFEAGKIRINPDDLTVKAISIFNIEEKQAIPIQNEIRAKVIDINNKSKKAIVEAPGGMVIEIEMYGWAPFRYSCWQKDKEIRLMYKKMYGDSNYRKIIDPIVLPEDIVIDNREEFFKDMIFVSNRRYPSELHNRMYYEYKIRTLED